MKSMSSVIKTCLVYCRTAFDRRIILDTYWAGSVLNTIMMRVLISSRPDSNPSRPAAGLRQLSRRRVGCGVTLGNHRPSPQAASEASRPSVLDGDVQAAITFP